jgi:hypothetical protein
MNISGNKSEISKLTYIRETWALEIALSGLKNFFNKIGA